MRALDLLLLVVATASSDPPTVTEYAAAWARTIGLGRSPSALGSVSKAWRRLEDRKLIRRYRDGRKAGIELLKEDGSGDPYHTPGKKRELFFKIPFEYWRQGLDRELSLAGKAALLIALERPDGFPLPAERGPAWYGLSADTIQHGLKELRRRGLLNVDVDWRKEPLSQLGYTEERLYTLAPPFGPKDRLSKAARRRLAEREKALEKDVLRTPIVSEPQRRGRRTGP
jgi:hypothetical protein